jgi:hypothetical protein
MTVSVVGIVVQRVDGEVASGSVLFHRTEHVVVQDAAVLVGRGIGVTTEGRHLYRVATHHHVHDLEAPTDHACPAEHCGHLFRRGTGCHVEVLRRDACDQVAHRATHDIGLIALRLQPFAHPARRRQQGVARDAVLRDREADRPALPRGVRSGVVFGAPEHPAQQLSDHQSRGFLA